MIDESGKADFFLVGVRCCAPKDIHVATTMPAPRKRKSTLYAGGPGDFIHFSILPRSVRTATSLQDSRIQSACLGVSILSLSYVSHSSCCYCGSSVPLEWRSV